MSDLAAETAKVIFMMAQEMGIDVQDLEKRVREEAFLHLDQEQVPAVLDAIKKGAEDERRFR